MKKILLISTFFICFYSYGQINIGGKPYSFKNVINAVKVVEKQTPRIEFQKLNFDKLIAEDKQKKAFGPYRYGKVMKVSYDWNNSGKWIELENGDRIWKLEIHCPMAKSINLSYDKFWLPEGGVLYVYDEDGSKIIGGLTTRNNQGSEKNPLGYATGLLFDDNIVLEYYEPSEVRDKGIISISKVVYGYKAPTPTISKTSTDSDVECAININCSPEGDDWQDEKTSVVNCVTSGGVFTGSLINNTRNDGTPYILTAHHNIQGITNDYDAITNPNIPDIIFEWEYEYLDCEGNNLSTIKETVGAIVVANSSTTDFALLRIIETPYDINPQFQAFYNGWDRRTPYSGNVCIHHPQFKPKKIAIDNNLPTTDETYFWRVRWDPTTNGYSMVYPGSSGSPLFNIYRNDRIVGQLSGADDHWINYRCDGTQNANFGKFSISWGGNSDPRRRLKDWLDPDNTDALGIDGIYCSGANIKYIQNTNYYSDEDVFGCSMEIQNVSVGNNAIVVFHAANDIVITSSFEVALGSEVQINQY